MVSQATREYLKNMYERDMSNDEIIIRRLDTMIDLTQEMLDVMRMILANQNQAYLLAGIKQDIDMCNRIGCNHHIDYHKLFGGCQVSECECEQFDRKES